MKKTISLLLAGLMIALCLTACSNQSASQSATSGSGEGGNQDKLQVVATIFPQYDWVRQILGEEADRAELTLLLDNGVDLHSYQPTADDIIKISTCDLFIYTGGESDAWVEDALENATNPNMVVINLLEVLGEDVKEEEIVEGMEHEHEEFDPDAVKDRHLSDFSGDWVTIENALKNGDIDDYISQSAEENEMDVAAQKAAFEERWASEYEKITVTQSAISFGATSSDYKYIGYKIVESEHDTSVWYGFEAQSPKEGLPTYVAFSDYSTDTEHEHADDHQEEHEEEEDAQEGAALHMRYGNESFDALANMENWSPTYFVADATDTEIAEIMSGYSHGQEHESDEHVWLSLRNAKTLTGAISSHLGELDPDYADVYAANAAEYQGKLSALDEEYKEAVKSGSNKTLLFADRFPFRYLVDDYGLSYFAAFSGCSAETEASFETVVFLSDKVNELRLKHIMVIETSDQSIAKTVIQNTAEKDGDILVLDSMQSVTAADIASGESYLSIMKSNLDVLKQALN